MSFIDKEFFDRK